MKYALQIGKLLIDLNRPQADQIDLDAIEERLRAMHRWSNDPAALTVHQHREFVALLAEAEGHPQEVIDWCRHHDDHEAVTGDIPGPLKHLIASDTTILMAVEISLDHAICEARGVPYPSEEVRRIVHFYDKASETFEWIHVLKQPPVAWNSPLPLALSKSEMHDLLNVARSIP